MRQASRAGWRRGYEVREFASGEAVLAYVQQASELPQYVFIDHILS